MANEDVKETNAGDFALDMGEYGIPAQELRCPGCEGFWVMWLSRGEPSESNALTAKPGPLLI